MSRLRSLSVPLALLAGTTALVACGSDGGSGATATTAGSGSTAPVSGTINGQGSSFQKAFNDDVIDEFKKAQSGATVNYQATGSSAGRQALADQTADFAGTDSAVKAEDAAKYKGGQVLHFPTVAAPITVAYNGGPDKLVLDAETLGKIFSLQVKTWDDAAIKALNPGATLPSDAIKVVVRSDGSGTSENFTKYLSAAAPSSFTIKPGSQPEWPAGVTKAEKNSGVAQAVKTTTGAIGYIDLSDARSSGLKLASVKNKAGNAVEPTLKAASAALAGATVKDDLTYDPLDAAGADAYPITSPTWIIVYANQTDKVKGATLKAFLTYVLGDGQEVAEDADFARLPDALATKAKAQLDKIVVPAT